MIFEKFIDIDLGQISYIIACEITKEAFIVDPRRDINEYDSFIEDNFLSLKYVFNTHTHADYIGGHIELAHKYNVENIFQNSAPIENFSFIKVYDNDLFKIGSTLTLKVLETPGHTPFDLSLLLNENNIDKAVFTGDSLFVGDIGRPDLLGEENLLSLANSSYNSSKKLWNLDNEIMIFTSHIKGSLCGKNQSQQYFSTIGLEKKSNYTFQLSQDTKEKYIEYITSLNIETPSFFKKMAGLNIQGPKLIEKILKNIKRVQVSDIINKTNIQIIDLRKPNEFYKKHIINSINIAEASNVSLIAGNILDYEKDIYIITNENSNLGNYITKLLRVGLDNIKGVVNSDFNLIDDIYLTSSNTITLDQITDEFTNILLDKECLTIKNSIDINISDINNNINIDKYNKVIFHCNYGYKTSAISSLLNSPNIYYLITK